jgi:hypothetical protein
MPRWSFTNRIDTCVRIRFPPTYLELHREPGTEPGALCNVHPILIDFVQCSSHIDSSNLLCGSVMREFVLIPVARFDSCEQPGDGLRFRRQCSGKGG